MTVGDLVVIAPIVATRESALRAHLRGLRTSPLEQLPFATHFARFVVLPLDGPVLLFSARFDGRVDGYLASLADLPEAAAIWSHCSLDEDLHDAATLRAFLTRHRVRSPYVLSAWPSASVAEVNTALDRQTALSRFALESGELDPVGLAHAVRERFAR